MTKTARPRSNDTLADNILALRDELGISQDELAFRAAMHRTYLSGIERRRSNITLDVLDRLADALKVDPSTLLKPRR